MAGFYNLDHKEVIRVKVKKCDGRMQPEYKKFSIDPQITSFEMLQGILARAFEITSDFTISYLARDSEGQAVYLSMLSDWDMDAAFQCAADPCLKLKVDLRPFEEELEDWDVIAPAEIPHHRITSLLDKNSILGSITGTITQNLGKTVNSVQRAMGLKQAENEVIKPLKPPMSDMEFKNYLDSEGHMIRPNEFRLSVYQGGIEPSLRRVAWRHLLNIFPANMSGQSRFYYMKRKEEEYRNLKEEWLERFKNNTATEEVKYVASMVKKDVLRTDRCHGFYAGNDENENTLSLFHILVTYALTHPDVSYCQGMSDLASPLLVTQKDEGQAYICFCALMGRLRDNFTLEGNAIMSKFKHLSELLSMYDPLLHAYLVQNSAGDMFFCYRWFLLELKREFPFTDALYVLEVMWATLPPSPPPFELALVDPDYSCKLLSSSPSSPSLTMQHAMYAKLLAMRRVGALHKATRASLPISSPVSRASANNNLSTETLPPVNASAVSSFDTSPGDTEDRGDFPAVDNVMTRSMQMKSNSIDLILQEDTTSIGDENVGSIEVKENSEDFNEHSRNSCVLSTTLTSQPVSSDLKGSSKLSDSHFVDTEPSGQSVAEVGGYIGTDCDDERNERSWSINSAVSGSSENSEGNTQFTLSLDSNINNSTEASENLTVDTSIDVLKTSQDKDSGNGLYKKSKSPSKIGDTQDDSGIFQSMKRLLASPKRKPNSSSPDLTASPSSSPKKSVRTTPVGGMLPPGTDDIQRLMKNNSSDSHLSDCQEATESLESSVNNSPHQRDPSKLPPPQEFGAGNPFLIFLCLTLLVQHREKIIQQGMCYEDIAMYFDRLVRRHDANRVLHHARQMYTEYLRAQQANMEKERGDSGELGMSC
ncbi:TBC1 domain family member 25-like [Physella acuta]|uniref:TBC1 domain family member 25-like n=1 Tax=Physella acuta TaxID=109671 RepID=UPI0027DCCB1F|nr:TBC1 domain family member 25-like [Physella acuta]